MFRLSMQQILRRRAAMAAVPSTSSSGLAVRSVVTTSFRLPDPAQADGAGQYGLTKIVATIGPTSEQAEPLQRVTTAGMKIMRLNFSHATVEEVELRCTNLAAAEQALSPSSAAGVPPQTTRAILLDTKGPEIRSGKLAHDDSGHATMTLEAGKTITLQTNADRYATQSTVDDLYIDYPALATAVQPHGKVLLDDGAVVLTVQSVDPAAGTVSCCIDNTGDLRSRAGVNLPLADTSDLPALSEKDKADIAYGLTKDIDIVAASFVQTAQGVNDIKAYLAEAAKKVNWQGPLPLVVSKIETASALQHFDEILKASDGIMVARGDLGVEIPLTQVCNAQKEMVHACNASGKPVIVATQMLESMAKNPRPTRAEVADVTNAVYDGADCVMLSGESAKGKYPDTAVRTMDEIIRAAELYQESHDVHAHEVSSDTIYGGDGSTAANLAKAAVTLADFKEKIKAIVVADESDNQKMAKMTSAFRPHVPIYALSTEVKAARQLQIFRGIQPVLMEKSSDLAEEGPGLVKRAGYLDEGDFCAVVSSTQLHVVQV